MKCKITCVKVWMGLAVTGCVMTLILAAIVLSSYSFEPVIGPLSCQVKRIETASCCYDEDCIYGKQYIYYFSSNSSHCMNKFDLYDNPRNTSVRFREESSCYPSLKSLTTHAHNWRLNESITFYVNNECTQWLEASVHAEHVNTNILWIAIILSFVGCSCVSMICGFITMYHIEILTCFMDYCFCGHCNEYLYKFDDYDSDSSLKAHKNGAKHRLSSYTNSTSSSPIKKADRERLKPSPPSPIAVVLKGDGDKSRSIHFNQMTNMQFALQPPQYNRDREEDAITNKNGSDTNKPQRRPRRYSKESQISRLSPISVSKESEFKQFRAKKGSGKIQIHKAKEKHLKNRVYTAASPIAHDEDDDDDDEHDDIEDAIDDDEEEEIDDDDDYEYKSHGNQSKDVQSMGLSESRHYENEWYDETSSITTKSHRKRTNLSTSSQHDYHYDYD